VKEEMAKLSLVLAIVGFLGRVI